jgi:GT2 family glycosyltransferase
VVLVSRDRRADLERALAAFHAALTHEVYDDLDRPHTERFADFELIAVDDASSDGSAAFLRVAAQRGLVSRAILARTRRGDAACANLAIAHARPGAFAYVKLGAAPPTTPGWLPRMLDVLRRDPAIGALAVDGQVRAPTRVVDLEPISAWARRGTACAALAVPRAVFARAGHFAEDEAIAAGTEDLDYLGRVAGDGLGVYTLPAIRAPRRRAPAPPASAAPRFYPRYEGCGFDRDEAVIELD